MTKPDIIAIAKVALEQARKRVIDGGEVLRTVYARSRDGKLFIIVVPGEGEENELKLLQMLRFMFIRDDIVAYSMVSEVWTSSDSEYTRGNGKMPMDDPQRGEALIILAVSDETLESGTVRRRILKGEAPIRRRPTSIGDVEWSEDGTGGASITGRWTLLMPSAGAPADVLALMRAKLRDLDCPAQRIKLPEDGAA